MKSNVILSFFLVGLAYICANVHFFLTILLIVFSESRRVRARAILRYCFCFPFMTEAAWHWPDLFRLILKCQYLSKQCSPEQPAEQTPHSAPHSDLGIQCLRNPAHDSLPDSIDSSDLHVTSTKIARRFLFIMIILVSPNQ